MPVFDSFLQVLWLSVSLVQDSVFRLESHIENGRGKSPYDPKLLTASMLIGEFKTGYTVLLFCVLEQAHIKTQESWKHPLPCSFILADI